MHRRLPAGTDVDQVVGLRVYEAQIADGESVVTVYVAARRRPACVWEGTPISTSIRQRNAGLLMTTAVIRTVAVSLLQSATRPCLSSEAVGARR